MSIKYRKRPVEIEAFRFGIDSIPDWFMDKVSTNEIILRPKDDSWRSQLSHCEIKTLEGTMTGKYGDWIIRGVAGEIYPCKSPIFAITYEPA